MTNGAWIVFCLSKSFTTPPRSVDTQFMSMVGDRSLGNSSSFVVTPKFASWLSYHVLPFQASVRLSFIVFLALVPLELALVLTHTETFSLGTILWTFLTFSFVSLLYGYGFEFIYSVTRFLGIAFSRLTIWSPIVTGASLFFLLGLPILQNATSLQSIPLLLGILSICVLLSVPLLAVFPVLRGMNATVLFMSSLAGSLLQFLDPHVHWYAGFVGAISLFFLLQIRYKFSLSPDYQYLNVPKSMRMISFGFLIGSISLAFLEWGPKYLWLVCTILWAHWLMMAWLHESKVGWQIQGFHILFACVAGLLLGTSAFQNTYALGSSQWARESLRAVGTLAQLNSENSVLNDKAWGTDECKGDKNQCLLKEGGAHWDFSPKRKELLIVSAPDFARVSWDDKPTSGSLSVMSSNRDMALYSLINGVNGIEASRGQRGTSLWTILSDAGYRTICIGNHSNPDMTRGCQIVLPYQDATEAYRSYRKYKEKKTIVWIDSAEKIDLHDFSAFTMLLVNTSNTFVWSIESSQKILRSALSFREDIASFLAKQRISVRRKTTWIGVHQGWTYGGGEQPDISQWEFYDTRARIRAKGSQLNLRNN